MHSSSSHPDHFGADQRFLALESSLMTGAGSKIRADIVTIHLWPVFCFPCLLVH